MRKIMVIFLIIALSFTMVACGKQTANNNSNSTTPSNQTTSDIFIDFDAIDNGENTSNNTHNNNTLKATIKNNVATYPVSEEGIKNLTTFYTTTVAENLTSPVQGVVYRNAAENAIIIDGREEVTPFNITCKINTVDGKKVYSLKFQWGYEEDESYECDFDGNGTIFISLSGSMNTKMTGAFPYPTITSIANPSDNDKLAENIHFNNSNIDFSQKTKNPVLADPVIIEVKKENISKMINFKEVELAYGYQEDGQKNYANEAKVVLIYDSRTNKSKINYSCTIGKNKDGENVFIIKFNLLDEDGKEDEFDVETPGYGVTTVSISDAGYSYIRISSVTSTDVYTK